MCWGSRRDVDSGENKIPLAIRYGKTLRIWRNAANKFCRRRLAWP